MNDPSPIDTSQPKEEKAEKKASAPVQAASGEPIAKRVDNRGRIYDSILDTMGNTPLVRVSRFAEKHEFGAEVLAKLEFFNPIASVKDRIGFAMIEAAEREGKITPGETTIIEPTSGNTGIALAYVCAVKGYRLVLTMPETMSLERRRMLKLLGAELHLTPAEGGMKAAIDMAKQMAADEGDAFIPGQFENPANPQIHSETTAEEIWKDTEGKVDIIISGVGTGGTITGIAQALKPRKADLQIYAVEPEESAVLSGEDPGPHKIQGIGAGFIPAIVDQEVIDKVLTVDSQTAVDTAREIARTEGIPCGISSGAAFAAAKEAALMEENKGKTIVVIIPSFAERYFSTVLFDGLE